jgi:hypothetical protein
MDRKQSMSNLIPDILKEGKFYISVQQTDNKIDIYSAIDDKHYLFIYDDQCIHINERIIKCPEYAIESIFRSYLTSICGKYNFHEPYVIYESPLNFNQQVENKKDFDYIYKDIIRHGLRPYHVALAKENLILKGLQVLLEVYYDLN